MNGFHLASQQEMAGFSAESRGNKRTGNIKSRKNQGFLDCSRLPCLERPLRKNAREGAEQPPPEQPVKVLI